MYPTWDCMPPAAITQNENPLRSVAIRQALDRYICNFTWNPIKEVHVYVSLFLYSCHRDEKMETETMHLRGGGIAAGFLDIYISIYTRQSVP